MAWRARVARTVLTGLVWGCRVMKGVFFSGSGVRGALKKLGSCRSFHGTTDRVMMRVEYPRIGVNLGDGGRGFCRGCVLRYRSDMQRDPVCLRGPSGGSLRTLVSLRPHFWVKRGLKRSGVRRICNSPGRVLPTGRHATAPLEPCQVRKEAALRDVVCVVDRSRSADAVRFFFVLFSS